MPHAEEPFHVGKGKCLLCRQKAEHGSAILSTLKYHLEVGLKRFIVPRCPSLCSRCIIRMPNPDLWVHEICYDLLMNCYETNERPALADLLHFATSTKELYEPLDKEKKDIISVWEGLLNKRTELLMKNCFTQELFTRLPLELQLAIASFIGPCSFLIVLGETRRLMHYLRSGSAEQSEQISLSSDVHLAMIEYQGTAYVTRISNMPLESCFENVVHMKAPVSSTKIVLSTDHIGLRAMQFLDQGAAAKPDGSPWYQTVKVLPDKPTVYVSHDGLFVRKVQNFLDKSSTMSINWSSPCQPQIESRNMYHCNLRGDLRLQYASFCSEKVQGILVCCSRSATIGVHIFSGKSKKFEEFTSAMRQMALKRDITIYWLYFPVNTNGSFQFAWVRHLRGTRAKGAGLVLRVGLFLTNCLWATAIVSIANGAKVQTSKGRTITFGPQIPTQLRDVFEFDPLVKDGDGYISGIFHDGLDPAQISISAVGVTCEPQRLAAATPVKDCVENYPLPPGPPGGGSQADSWFLSKASLKNIVKVELCQDQEEADRPCIGLVLHYEDCHIESLGQIRWDFDVGHGIPAPFLVRKSVFNTGKIHAKDFKGEPIIDDEWQELPKSGNLVWWFGHLGDRLAIYDE